MWQNLIVSAIVGTAFFFTGKIVFHIMRQAMDPKKNISCGGGCGGCGVNDCEKKISQKSSTLHNLTDSSLF